MSVDLTTRHVVHFNDAREMTIEDESIDLIVTSPPYPMISMWDEIFGNRDQRIGSRLASDDGVAAYELMHAQLDVVWAECWRVLGEGGIACINVGDAVRTVGGTFRLYPNHARILSSVLSQGFSALPAILWRKPTNSPTKFLGSGVLPAGAYVTLEHEHILIFRKGKKRSFRGDEKRERRESAIFWEERNAWFSDVWMDLPGISQMLDEGGRSRSGAFPLELAFRLILMHSVRADVVLDPFMGTGTTGLASAVAGRSSVGYELSTEMGTAIDESMERCVEVGETIVCSRLGAHRAFVERRSAERGSMKYQNGRYGFPVMTTQEKELVLTRPTRIEKSDNERWTVQHTMVE